MIYSDVALWMFWGALYAMTAFCLYKMAITDWRRRIIPDVFLFPVIISGLISVAFFPHWPIQMGDAIVGGAFGYGLAMIVGMIFQRAHKQDEFPPIGLGDIKLVFAGGLFLGCTGLAWALALACVGAMIWGRIKHVRYIPFAPFFIIGGILSFIANVFLI